MGDRRPIEFLCVHIIHVVPIEGVRIQLLHQLKMSQTALCTQRVLEVLKRLHLDSLESQMWLLDPSLRKSRWKKSFKKYAGNNQELINIIRYQTTALAVSDFCAVYINKLLIQVSKKLVKLNTLKTSLPRLLLLICYCQEASLLCPLQYSPEDPVEVQQDID